MTALSGVKVIDLTRVLAGPFCTMILGDLGAEVIKVEAPGGSDDTRSWGPPFASGESAYYLCVNRNKKAITLDLKSDQGREVLKKLVTDADVLIHNFKNGTMEKWGLSYDELNKINSKLIYCAITGFGANGPYKNLAGYDYIIQAMSGLMSITGSKESGPMKVGVAITDVLTGQYAATGIVSALYEREQSNEGQSIDISLLDSLVSSLVNVASNYLVTGNLPQRLGNIHPNIVPYQPFQTKDKEIVVAVGNDKQFKRFCEILNLQNLIEDEKFLTNSKRVENRIELEKLILEKMLEKNAVEWIKLLNEAGIPCGPINNMEELFNDPQIKARDMVIEIEHPTVGRLPVVGSPLKLAKTPVTYLKHPPLVGEHTFEVLRELGFSDNEIQEMEQKNII